MIKLSKFTLNSFSCIKSSNLNRLCSDMNKLYSDINFKYHEYKFLKEALQYFNKSIKSTPESYLITELKNKWTILFDDQLNSDGCSSILYNLNRLFRYEGFKMNYNQNGITFTYYSEKESRTINSYFDSGKWIFYQKGKIMFFENSSYYKRKKIVEKFNINIFYEYTIKMGLGDLKMLVKVGGKTYYLKKIVTE